MERDRKKRLLELKDAHQRRPGSGSGESAGLAGTKRDNISNFLKEIVRRSGRRGDQLAMVQDFLETSSTRPIGNLPSDASASGRGAAGGDDLRHRLNLVRDVLKDLENEAGPHQAVERPPADGRANAPAGSTGTQPARPRRLPCRLVVHREGEPAEAFELTSDKLLIGRRSVNDICLRDRAVSGRHALIVPDSAGWLIVDLGSTNGTQVNGTGIRQHPLADGDEIRIGRCRLIFHGGSGGDSTPPAANGDFGSTVVLDK